jgi:hypothetical protein
MGSQEGSEAGSVEMSVHSVSTSRGCGCCLVSAFYGVLLCLSSGAPVGEQEDMGGSYVKHLPGVHLGGCPNNFLLKTTATFLLLWKFSVDAGLSHFVGLEEACRGSAFFTLQAGLCIPFLEEALLYYLLPAC